MKWCIYVKNGTRFDGLLDSNRPSVEDLRDANNNENKYSTLDIKTATGFADEIAAQKFIDTLHAHLKPRCRVVFAIEDNNKNLCVLSIEDMNAFRKMVAEGDCPDGDNRMRLEGAGLVFDGLITKLGGQLAASF